MLSTNAFGSIIEESLWALSGALLIISFISIWPRVCHEYKSYLITVIVLAMGFVIFMVTVDVPMYWYRWQADTISGVEYLSLSEGMIDSLYNCTVSLDMKVWKSEIPWMTLYFSVAVWLSLSLPYAPYYKTYCK